ncbi:MAG: HAD-IC family P-type ATPase [Puniceicoccaceae bacterium]
MPTASTFPESGSASHIQRPECCVLPERSDARDYLGSFVSLRDGMWIRLGIAIILAGQSMVWGLAVNLSEIPAFSPVYWGLHGILALSALAVVLMLGGGLLREFVGSVRHLRLGIESLFMLSLLGALGGSLFATLRGVGDVYYEVIIVVLVIFSLGRRMGQVSKERALAEAHRYREQFDTVVRISAEGVRESIPYACLVEGDVFEVGPGLPICADGHIVSGAGFVRETALTGEPHPLVKQPGDRVRAGTWSVDATLRCEAVIDTGGRLIDNILRKVEDSIASTQSRRQLQAERWIRHFVLVVAAVAVSTGLFWTWREGLSTGWLNAMSVLLIACPCALGLATPLAVWTGLWQLSSMGLVSRTAPLMDALAHTRHVFFDKTGTLTLARLTIGEVRLSETCPWTQEQVLALGALLESDIEHPVARAFAQEELTGSSESLPDDLHLLHSRWIPGSGVEAQVRWNGNTSTLRLGTPQWAVNESQRLAVGTDARKRICLARDNEVLAEVELVESLRPGVSPLILRLQTLGIRSTVLTGDPLPQWSRIAGATVRENLSPDDKAALVKHSRDQGEVPLFVGDGINDLNAMLAAEASIAIHDGGASLTQSNASAILTGDRLEPIGRAIRLARRIDQTLLSNMRIAVSYNVVGISFAVAGLLHPVASALIMIASSLLVTLRAIRKAEALSEQV